MPSPGVAIPDRPGKTEMFSYVSSVSPLPFGQLATAGQRLFAERPARLISSSKCLNSVQATLVSVTNIVPCFQLRLAALVTTANYHRMCNLQIFEHFNSYS